MIKLERADKPEFLTDDVVYELTEIFKNEKKDVWKHKDIKKNLLDSSFDKCAYCECNIDEESKYLEVEHFEDKDTYPDKVVVWENLLPSCKRCNGNKGTHNVIDEPIINPYIHSPNQHFYLKNYRLKHKTNEGEMSISVLDLNNYKKVVKKRFDIGCKLYETIELAVEKLDLYLENKSTLRKNKLRGIVKGILEECQEDSIYCATSSTILHSDDNFIKVMDGLKSESLWTVEYEFLYQKSKEYIL